MPLQGGLENPPSVKSQLKIRSVLIRGIRGFHLSTFSLQPLESFVPLCLCAFVPLCLCAFVPFNPSFPAPGMMGSRGTFFSRWCPGQAAQLYPYPDKLK